MDKTILRNMSTDLKRLLKECTWVQNIVGCSYSKVYQIQNIYKNQNTNLIDISNCPFIQTIDVKLQKARDFLY